MKKLESLVLRQNDIEKRLKEIELLIPVLNKEEEKNQKELKVLSLEFTDLVCKLGEIEYYKNKLRS
jgi:hypothetical protein